MKSWNWRLRPRNLCYRRRGSSARVWTRYWRYSRLKRVCLELQKKLNKSQKSLRERNTNWKDELKRRTADELQTHFPATREWFQSGDFIRSRPLYWNHNKILNNGFVRSDSVQADLCNLGAEIYTSRFDKTVAAAAISTIINQMSCPTGFINEEVQVHSDKQQLIVGEYGNHVDRMSPVQYSPYSTYSSWFWKLIEQQEYTSSWLIHSVDIEEHSSFRETLFSCFIASFEAFLWFRK